MKRKHFLFLILGGVAAYFYLSSDDKVASLSNDTPVVGKLVAPTLFNKEMEQLESISSVYQAESKVPPKTRARKLRLPDRDVEEPTRQMKLGPNEVRFEVKNGMAVIQGDVLLGRIEQPEGRVIKKGKFRAPENESWQTEEIPYAIHPDTPNKEEIKKALYYMSEHTVLSFIPLSNEEDAIVFMPGEEYCYSYLGRVGGHQPILLSDQCRMREVMHEVMHSLGFIHEQSRKDRDQFVEIVWNNIKDGFEIQFEKATDTMMEPLEGTDFDYNSVMLYQPTAFAREKGLVTIRSKTDRELEPVRFGLSDSDIERINYRFGH